MLTKEKKHPTKTKTSDNVDKGKKTSDKDKNI